MDGLLLAVHVSAMAAALNFGNPTSGAVAAPEIRAATNLNPTTLHSV